MLTQISQSLGPSTSYDLQAVAGNYLISNDDSNVYLQNYNPYSTWQARLAADDIA